MMGINFTPFPVLKTARLTLRQLKSSDANEIFALRSNGNVNKYIGRKPATSIDDATGFIGNINENIQRNESVYWAITFSDTDKLIGTICLFNFSQDPLKAEIGYELLPEFQGRGIMYEAASKVIHFGFEHAALQAIAAGVHNQNQRSIHLLKKLNFKSDGVAHDSLTFKLARNA